MLPADVDEEEFEVLGEAVKVLAKEYWYRLPPCASLPGAMDHRSIL